jgi:hypothetical protein
MENLDVRDAGLDARHPRRSLGKLAATTGTSGKDALRAYAGHHN